MKFKRLYNSTKLEFYTADTNTPLKLPLFTSKVAAGFPSPAEDYVELKLDLNKFLISHPAATFYVRVKGSSMINAGINDGDILIVDRSLEAKNKDIAVCMLNGEFTVKRIKKVKSEIYLVPENPDFTPIKILKENEFEIWGVVSYIIHKP